MSQLAAPAGSGLIEQIDQDEAAILEQFDQAYQSNVDNAAEVRIARLALLQSKSPEIEEAKDGYKAGQYVNNFTREIYSTEDKAPWLLESGVDPTELGKPMIYMAFIPVIKLPTEFIKWTKRKDRKPGDPPFEFKTLDQSDPRVREGVWPKRNGTWGKKPGQTGAPPVTDNINFLALPFDYATKTMLGNFCVVTFSRTSSMGGVNLTTQLDSAMTVQRLRSFQTIFFLYSKNEQKRSAEGTNWVQTMQVARSKFRAKDYVPDLYQLALGMGGMLSDKISGPARQAQILGAAEIAPDDNHEEDGNVVPGTATAPAGDDPFPGEAPAGTPF